jgi:hypothetical protein
MNWFCRWTAALLVICASVAAEDVPELDIVVTSKVTPANLPAEHTDALVKALTKDTREIFFRLVSPNLPIRPEAPKDGAAKHRLFVDHAATINCGIQISMKADSGGNVGGDYTVRRWYVPFDQKGTVAVRLAKWTGEKYEDIIKFSAPVPKNERELRDGAAMQIAERAHRGGSVGTDSNQCPVGLDEARKTALRQSLPPTLRSTLYSKLVPITLVKAGPGGKPGEVQVELKVENKTPWPLKRAEYAFAQGSGAAAQHFMAGEERGMPGNTAFSLPEPLAPGQSTTVKTGAKAHQGKLPSGTQNAEFVTGATP